MCKLFPIHSLKLRILSRGGQKAPTTHSYLTTAVEKLCMKAKPTWCCIASGFWVCLQKLFADSLNKLQTLTENLYNESQLPLQCCTILPLKLRNLFHQMTKNCNFLSFETLLLLKEAQRQLANTGLHHTKITSYSAVCLLKIILEVLQDYLLM